MGVMAIETSGLSRRFGEILAVDDIDVNVPSGAIYGFLGPNGAGKTTTIRMLLSLIRPTSGEVKLFEQSVRGNRKKLMQRVGALVEIPSLYGHLTGRENLEVTRRLIDVAKTRIDTVIKTVDLADAADRLVRTYSLGMKQRLGLALALLAEPELLILDEPTNGLDPAGMKEMRGLLKKLASNSGITIFLSSHLLTEVERIADHVGIIQSGKLVFQGTVDELNARQQPLLEVGCNDTAAAIKELTWSGIDSISEIEGLLVLPCSSEKQSAEINSLLTGAGLAVHHLSLRKPTLEEVFMDLTTREGGER